MKGGGRWYRRGAEVGLLKTPSQDLALSSSSSQAYALEPDAFFVLPPLVFHALIAILLSAASITMET